MIGCCHDYDVYYRKNRYCSHSILNKQKVGFFLNHSGSIILYNAKSQNRHNLEKQCGRHGFLLRVCHWHNTHLLLLLFLLYVRALLKGNPTAR